MRSLFVLLATSVTTVIATAADLTPKDLVAQLYQARRSSHYPLGARFSDIYEELPDGRRQVDYGRSHTGPIPSPVD